jgi:hypothetical protein
MPFRYLGLKLVILDISRTSCHFSGFALTFQAHAVPRDVKIEPSPTHTTRTGLSDTDFPTRSVDRPLAVFGLAESFCYADRGREIPDRAAGDCEADGCKCGAGRAVRVEDGV